ncbi:ethanolamine utilization protein EutN [Nocardioides daedukensis]|uniref:Ethanolamine utilization protein EutN n=1 Tax=Nocardioides daedukensis TaxID=634462 RepID=A0A7Y9RV00_9ACTN|nr:EutN/CcmL family microcompartment protein [Nocardioides daedukensis]NYG57127.1 ethanolamine utilization protein EutN [Nocardioides daedukensis]
MLRAVVTGNVWSTKRIEGLPNGAFLELVTENGGAHLVAFDVLGTGIGEHVLVAQGSVAAAWFPGTPPPVDALVIGSIDQPPAAKPTRAAKSVAPSTAKAKTNPE